MTRILISLFLLLIFGLSPGRAQFPDQATYVVGGGTNAQTASFPNATALADLLGVPLRILAGGSNTGAATLTVNTFIATNILKTSPSGPVGLTGGEIVSGQVYSVVYDGSNFQLISAVNNASVSGGCSLGNLIIINNAGTPNTNIDVSYSSSTLVVPSTGAAITSGVKSFTINTTTGAGGTSTANGMDGTARGNNNMVSLWAISNGTTWAGLASSIATYPTVPTLPAGYIYACYIGTKKTDGSGNFYGTRQVGRKAFYLLNGNLLTAALPLIVTGGVGANCSSATVTYAASTIRGTTGAGPIWIPSTANIVYFSINAGAGGNVSFAPNTSYGGTNGFFFNSSTTATNSVVTMLLEANTVQYCSTAAASILAAYGWEDTGVNAY